MPRWLYAVLIALTAALWWAGQRNSAPMAAGLEGNPAMTVCRAPPAPPDGLQSLQSDVGGRLSAFRMGDATIFPLAGFSVQARVLSREDYSLGREADYSPTDLALGWGAMSEPGLASRLNVRQGGRWYRYGWGGEGPPMAPSEIVRNSANMHMIPVDRDVARALSSVDADDIVRIRGWLVRIEGDNGWRWQSSLSRDDSGPGACELVLVCSIEKH